MDEKELKKLLDKELDKIAPSMSEKVKKARILTKSEQCEKSTQKIDIRPVKKRFAARAFAYGAVAAVLVVAIALAVILPPMLKTDNVAPVYEAGYLRMDINPSVEIVYDNYNNVTAVKSANSDADVLLTAALRESLQGKPVQEAAATIAEEAGKLGYIRPDETNAVKITVVAGSEQQQEKVAADVKTAIEDNFMKKGVFVAVVTAKQSADWLAQQYGEAAGSLSETLKDVAAKANGYFEQLAAQNSDGLAALKEYYEKEVFDYLKSILSAECARIARTREILHEIQAVNDEIIQYTGLSVLFGGYWETIGDEQWQNDPVAAEKFTRMQAALDKLYDLRGDDIAFSSSVELNAVVGLYDEFVKEDWLNEIGNATLDELKDNLDLIVDTLDKINAEITSAIREAVAFVPGTVQEFLDGTQKIIDGLRAELNAVYNEYYSEEREELTKKDYSERYDEILQEYGSLEEYWQSRNAA